MQKNIRPENPNAHAIIAAMIALIVVVFAFAAPIATSAYRKSTRITVVIDPGHGGADGGVVGVNTGVKESDLNLKVSKIVGEYLEGAGFNVIFTRNNKNGLYSDVLTGSKKREDMYRRADVIKRASPAAAVSIHMNRYTSSYRRGAQVFFDKNSASGREFASVMQETLNDSLNIPDVGKGFAALAAEKYILSCTSSPVVIVECGFLSNPIDEANLVDPDYQLRLGYVIFQGIVIYLSNFAAY